MAYDIPLSDIDLDEEEVAEVTKVLRSKWLSMGSVTKEFEKRFAEYLDIKYSNAVSNCTAALHIAHKLFNIKQGDEVIVPSLTFVATANSILYTGAKPIFADITNIENLNISPEDIQEKISPKTKAITIVHYAGYPCEMKSIMEIAEDHDLFVIEDAAHSPGGEYNGVKLGTIGDIGCFSFFSNKNLTTGEGGMIVTNNKDFAKKAVILRSHGMTSMTWDRHKGHSYSYDVVEMGYNFRIGEINSALGLVQLKKLDKNNMKRERVVKKYIKLLIDIPNVTIPFKDYAFAKPAYHIFPIILDENVQRRTFMSKLRDEGIQTSIHYPPIHLFSYYKEKFGYQRGLLPKTEYVADHLVTLPLHPLMVEKDVRYITQKMAQILCSF